MKQKIMKWIAWSTIGVSLLLYVLACALPSGVNVGIDPEDEVEGTPPLCHLECLCQSFFVGLQHSLLLVYH